MSDAILIKGARIIDPSKGTDVTGDLRIRDGVIIAKGKLEHEDTERIIHAKGLILTPGFIDLHTHLREPGQEDKETIQTGAAAGARGGFTTLCCMPNTSPPIDNAAIVDFIRKQAADAGLVRVFSFGAVSIGRKGEDLTDMEELAKAGVVGFTDDGAPVATGHLMKNALLYAAQLNLPVMDHCEDYSIVRGLGVHEGWVSSRLGLAGYPSAAEESIVARDIALSEMTGGHFHVAHLSTRGSIDLVRQAKKRGLRVTAEVTPHHLALTEEWVLGTHGLGNPTTHITPLAYDTRAKVSPPLRSQEDRAALIEALNDGTIDAIATDHAPHTFGDKETPFDDAAVGISVLDTAFGLLMRLVQTDEVDLVTLIRRLTTGPATILGGQFLELATLADGTPADIVLFDPNEGWIVDTATFASKGKNTPLDGEHLRGKIKLALVDGTVVYNEISS